METSRFQTRRRLARPQDRVELMFARQYSILQISIDVVAIHTNGRLDAPTHLAANVKDVLTRAAVVRTVAAAVSSWLIRQNGQQVAGIAAQSQ